MKMINLTRGMVAIVDTDDYEWLSQYRWSYATVGYATSRVDGRSAYMHRLIAGAKAGQYVDHINLNKLDNRRSNLRICNKQQNQQNQGPRRGSSRYKGVSWRKDTGKFSAQIHHNWKKICLGSFDSEKDAALAYNKAARKYHGEYAYQNKIS